MAINALYVYMNKPSSVRINLFSSRKEQVNFLDMFDLSNLMDIHLHFLNLNCFVS